MTEELSPADRASLAAERGAINMAVGGLLVFDPEPRLTRAMVIERIAERIHLVPRLRQRLEEPALGLANPVWVDDRGFDLDWHVRQASLPGAGGTESEAELGAFVGREFSHRLDRARPLWEMTLIEGLENGRTGLLAKVHHALVDGVAAIGMAALVLDPSEEPLDVAPPEREWAPRKYALRRHVAQLATKQLALGQRLMVDGMLRALDPDPRRAAGDMRRATDVALELARARPQAPMTPLNRPISPNRRFAVAHADLATVKRAGRRGDGTVNDALLAVVAGMLGRYLADAGADRDASGGRQPVALVPVSVRAPNEAGELGNRISTVFVDLPVGEADLLARIRAISAQTSQLKESAAVRAGALIVGAAGLGSTARLGPAGPCDGQRSRVQPCRLEHPGTAAAVLSERRADARGVPDRPPQSRQSGDHGRDPLL